MRKKVAVLGSTGMLGSMVTQVLQEAPDLDVMGYSRNREKAGGFLDALFPVSLMDTLFGFSWVINCIGLTKPMIQENDAVSVRKAIQVNSSFPHVLAELADSMKLNIMQIATDCVYSGATGMYVEESAHDATDVYGKTKSLGEVRFDRVLHLRCSIIGPEPSGRRKFLLEWLRFQPRDAQVQGYTNHLWNGVTTLQFARICLGVIRNDLPVGRLQHVVPDNDITKLDLLHALRKSYGREDIQVRPFEANYSVNRTLRTEFPDGNRELWEAAGYPKPPTVEGMVEEAAKYPFPM